eukprot:1546945-Rhodomonas_salina.1
MLAGHRLPADWKGGTVLLLTKREPASQIENMRPVTLLQVTYKLFTSVVSDRPSFAMEGGGLLEDGQNGFRQRKQTRSPVAKLQYVIHEAK